jgi:hypothetical protein
LWGISFAGVNLDRVSAVKFNPAGTLIFAGFEQVTPSLSLIFSVLNSADGNLIKSLKVVSSSTTHYFSKFLRMLSMLVDSNNNLFVGYQEI